MLRAGRVQVAVALSRDFQVAAKAIGFSGYSQLKMGQYEVYHYLHVRHRALVPRISAEISKMSESGELKQLIEKEK